MWSEMLLVDSYNFFLPCLDFDAVASLSFISLKSVILEELVIFNFAFAFLLGLKVTPALPPDSTIPWLSLLTLVATGKIRY